MDTKGHVKFSKLEIRKITYDIAYVHLSGSNNKNLKNKELVENDEEGVVTCK